VSIITYADCVTSLRLVGESLRVIYRTWLYSEPNLKVIQMNVEGCKPSVIHSKTDVLLLCRIDRYALPELENGFSVSEIKRFSARARFAQMICLTLLQRIAGWSHEYQPLSIVQRAYGFDVRIHRFSYLNRQS
jgi:hypothetical protein